MCSGVDQATAPSLISDRDLERLQAFYDQHGGGTADVTARRPRSTRPESTMTEPLDTSIYRDVMNDRSLRATRHEGERGPGHTLPRFGHVVALAAAGWAPWAARAPRS